MHLQVPGRPNDRPGLSLGPLRPAAIRVPEGVETEAAIVDLKDQPLGPSQEFLDGGFKSNLDMLVKSQISAPKSNEYSDYMISSWWFQIFFIFTPILGI